MENVRFNGLESESQLSCLVRDPISVDVGRIVQLVTSVPAPDKPPNNAQGDLQGFKYFCLFYPQY